MYIEEIKNKINNFIDKDCKGTVFAYDVDKNGKVFSIEDVVYMYDVLEAETEGVFLKLKEYGYDDSCKSSSITYGTILKVAGFTSNRDDEVDTVMIVNNITDGTGYNCKVLDLNTYEILVDYKDIDEFIANVKIIEVVGKFNELFNI